MLSKSTVQHIASLAKLKTSEVEAEKYAGELSHVLDYIDQLREVDTSKTIPTAQVTNLTNNLRADKVVDWNEEEKSLALKQADITEEGFVKVPKII
jgi:aspartyl-tRNA(Asn)/glutamyl-tRNA(Gln) amidotransferase subunit C